MQHCHSVQKVLKPHVLCFSCLIMQTARFALLSFLLLLHQSLHIVASHGSSTMAPLPFMPLKSFTYQLLIFSGL